MTISRYFPLPEKTSANHEESIDGDSVVEDGVVIIPTYILRADVISIITTINHLGAEGCGVVIYMDTYML